VLQAEYAGLIKLCPEEGEEVTEGPWQFGIVGLSCKRDLLQVGDPVSFQVDAEGRAANITPVRKKKKAVVDAVKGNTLC
jgi:hypothetical protein